MSKITVFISSVSSSKQIKKEQQKIEMILESKKIETEYVDISADESSKARMREIAGDPKALPPQIANGDQYCGNYEQFDDAVEEETLKEFLKLK